MSSSTNENPFSSARADFDRLEFKFCISSLLVVCFISIGTNTEHRDARRASEPLAFITYKSRSDFYFLDSDVSLRRLGSVRRIGDIFNRHRKPKIRPLLVTAVTALPDSAIIGSGAQSSYGSGSFELQSTIEFDFIL